MVPFTIGISAVVLYFALVKLSIIALISNTAITPIIIFLLICPLLNCTPFSGH